MLNTQEHFSLTYTALLKLLLWLRMHVPLRLAESYQSKLMSQSHEAICRPFHSSPPVPLHNILCFVFTIQGPHWILLVCLLVEFLSRWEILADRNSD